MLKLKKILYALKWRRTFGRTKRFLNHRATSRYLVTVCGFGRTFGRVS